MGASCSKGQVRSCCKARRCAQRIWVSDTYPSSRPDTRRLPNTSRVGHGVVIHVATASHPRGYLVPRALRDLAMAAAERVRVPYQLRVSGGGGGISDASAAHLAA